MKALFITATTAWIAAAMLLLEASLGLLRRKKRLLRLSHIALGAFLLPVAFVHAWSSMSNATMGPGHVAGLWLATAALLLLGLQLLIGTNLAGLSKPSLSLKRIHQTVGFGILSLVSLHVLLSRQ